MALRLGDLTRRAPDGGRGSLWGSRGRRSERRGDSQMRRSSGGLGAMGGYSKGVAGAGFGMLGTGYSTSKRLLGNLENELNPEARRQQAVNEASVNAELAAKASRGTLERGLTGTGGIKLGSGRAIGAMKDLEMRNAAMKAGEMNRAARSATKENMRDLGMGLDAASRMSGQGVSAIGTGIGGLNQESHGRQRLGNFWDNRATSEADLATMEATTPQPAQEPAPAPAQTAAPATTGRGIGGQAAAPQPGGAAVATAPKELINGQPAQQALGGQRPYTQEQAAMDGVQRQPGEIRGEMSMAGEPAAAAPPSASRFDPAQGVPQSPQDQDALLEELGYRAAGLSQAQRLDLLNQWQRGTLQANNPRALNTVSVQPPPVASSLF